MKKILIRTAVIIFAFLATVRSEAQTAATAPLKLAMIDSYLFQDQAAGVKKLLDIQKALDAEFKVKLDELRQLQGKFEQVSRNEEKATTPAEKNKLAEEKGKLMREYNFKKEQFESEFQKKQEARMNPLRSNMQKLMQQWCREKGFTAMLDLSKDEAGMVLYVEESIINKTTLDLIAYLNAKL